MTPHAYYLSTMVALFDTSDVAAAQLLRNTGLQSLSDLPALGFSATRMNTLCLNAIALSDDAQLGLRLGSAINLSAQGIFGYALMTSATVGDALKLLLRYSRALIPGVGIELQRRPGWVDVVVAVTHLPLQLQRFYCEVLYAAIIHNGRFLIGHNTVFSQLELSYSAPANRARYQQIFGEQVYFKAARCALSFDDASLGIAITAANPLAQDVFRRECDRLVSLHSRRGGIGERVQQCLLQSGSEFPTCAVVAGQLHMSESTLLRRLAREGCRYQQLLDQVRYRLATEYLLSTTLPVVEIACLLGFSDAANFRRAFRRWSGITPSDMRASRRNAAH